MPDVLQTNQGVTGQQAMIWPDLADISAKTQPMSNQLDDFSQKYAYLGLLVSTSDISFIG